MKKQYTKDYLLEILNSYGYNLLFDIDYINVKQNIHCIDTNGYKGVTTLDRLINKKSPFKIFHKKNPYSIDNINNFIKINNLNCKLLSINFPEGIGIKDKIKLLCNCGNTYILTLENFLNKKQDICFECKHPKVEVNCETKAKHKIRSYNDFLLLAESKGYNTISQKEEYVTTKSKMTITDGTYFYCTNYSNLKNDTPAPFHPTNPYTIQNINTYLKLNKNGNFTCVSSFYKNEKTELEFICNRCNDTFLMKWINASRRGMNRNGICCENCDGRIESLHACVLKQIFKHELADTVLEDNSCVNYLTGHGLPTDIVNHSMKIAIEIQSEYHDREYQKIKDKIKKEYWINKGYDFYALDIRDYSILEMTQVFFPNIEKIPPYVNMEYSNKLNIKIIQDYLNKNYSPREISNVLNINIHRIYDAIYDGRLSYSKTYIQSDYSPIVQLSIEGSYISEYNTIKEASKITGVPGGNISSCLYTKKHYSGGFLWYYKSDYYSENFTIVKNTRRRKEDFNIPIKKYDLNWNYIMTYENIEKAALDNNTSKTKILDAAEGKINKCANFYWQK